MHALRALSQLRSAAPRSTYIWQVQALSSVRNVQGTTPEQMKRYREAELTHGRVCMLAAVGILVGEQVQDKSLFYNWCAATCSSFIVHSSVPSQRPSRRARPVVDAGYGQEKGNSCVCLSASLGLEFAFHSQSMLACQRASLTASQVFSRRTLHSYHQTFVI